MLWANSVKYLEFSPAVLLKLKEKFYSAFVRSVTLYGNETWGLSVEQMARFDSTKMTMVCWRSGVSIKDMSNEALLERIAIEPVSNGLRKDRDGWNMY